MNRIAVDSNCLKNSIVELEETLKNCFDTMATFSNSVKGLEQVWIGSASSAFQDAYFQDQEFANQVLNKVSVLINCMNYSKEQYIEVENLISQSLDAIKM